MPWKHRRCSLDRFNVCCYMMGPLFIVAWNKANTIEHSDLGGGCTYLTNQGYHYIIRTFNQQCMVSMPNNYRSSA